MLGAILIFSMFVLVGVLGTMIIPSLPAKYTPTIKKNKNLKLYGIKIALDSIITVTLLLYWLWDPFHRYDFLKNSRLATTFNWVRFDTPCVRGGYECSIKNMIVFLWHMLFWSSAISIQWWRWIDPCVSYKRASSEKCVDESCDDETGMCECKGYKDWSILWTIIRIDMTTVATAIVVMLIFKGVFKLMGWDHGFWNIGQLGFRGLVFAGVLFVLRLLIEMGAMLFEGDVHLASQYLPSDVAGKLKECYTKESVNDIIASCGAVLKAASVEEQAKGGNIPETIGKLLVLHSQVTTIMITVIVLIGVFLNWVVNKIRKQERFQPKTYDLPDSQTYDLPDSQLTVDDGNGYSDSDSDSDEEKPELYNLDVAPSLVSPDMQQKLIKAAQENDQQMKESHDLKSDIRDLKTELEETQDPKKIQEISEDIKKLEDEVTQIDKKIDERKILTEKELMDKTIELQKETDAINKEDLKAGEELDNASRELEQAKLDLQESSEAAKQAAVNEATERAEASAKELEQTNSKIDENENRIKEKKEQLNQIVDLTADVESAQRETDSISQQIDKQQQTIKEIQESGDAENIKAQEKKLAKLQLESKQKYEYFVKISKQKEDSETTKSALEKELKTLNETKIALSDTRDKQSDANSKLKSEMESINAKAITDFKPRDDANKALSEAESKFRLAAEQKQNTSEKMETNKEKRANFDKIAYNSRLTDRQRMMEAVRDDLKTKQAEKNKRIGDFKVGMQYADTTRINDINEAIKNETKSKQLLDLEIEISEENLKIVNEVTELGKNNPSEYTQDQLDAMMDQRLAEKKKERMQKILEKDTNALEKLRTELQVLKSSNASKAEIKRKSNEIIRAEASNNDIQDKVNDTDLELKSKEEALKTVQQNIEKKEKQQLRKLKMKNRMKNLAKGVGQRVRNKFAKKHQPTHSTDTKLPNNDPGTSTPFIRKPRK